MMTNRWQWRTYTSHFTSRHNLRHTLQHTLQYSSQRTPRFNRTRIGMQLSKRLAATVLSVACLASLAACGSGADSSKGRVYFLNSKTEIVNQLDALAKEYTKETGVEVVVRTAAAGTNDQSLVSELAKSSAPTMFNIAGYDQFARFKKFMEPLQKTKVYSLLNDQGKRNAFAEDGNVYTLPYAAEWYGIIVNKAILAKYVQQPYAVIHSIDELNNYATLKQVTESMAQHESDLGLDAVWATPGLDASNDYRFAGHMIRVPIFYELRDKGMHFSDKLSGTYMSNYKDLWDLQVKYSPESKRSMLSSVNYEESTAQFAQGKVAFYTNGTWSYSTIQGNAVADNDLDMLPYYMGIKGEQEYGPFAIYDANWAVNARASEQDKAATLKFIEWMVTSDAGRKAIAQDMGLSAPFTTFDDAHQPKNPLITAARRYDAQGKKTPFSPTVPGIQWHDDFVNALTEYAQGTDSWKRVKQVVSQKWTEEWQNYQNETGVLPPTGTFDD